MGVLGIVKIDFFYKHFLNMDISLNNQQNCFKFCLHIVHCHFEGTVSQIFDLGLSFCFTKFGKLSVQK